MIYFFSLSRSRISVSSFSSAYGHVGRAPRTIVKEFRSKYEGNKTLTVELFTWEKLDYVERLKSEFGL